MTGNWDFTPAESPPTNHQNSKMCGTLSAIEEQRNYVGSSSKLTNHQRPSRIPRLVSRNKPNTRNAAANEQCIRPPCIISRDRKIEMSMTPNYSNYLDCGYSTEYENLAVGHFMPVSTLANTNYNTLKPQNGQAIKFTHCQSSSLLTTYPDQLVSSDPATYIPIQSHILSSCKESAKENIAQCPSDNSQNTLLRSQDDLIVLSSDLLDSVLANDHQLDNTSDLNLYLNSQTPSISDLYAYLQEEPNLGNQQDTWSRYSVLPPLSCNDGAMSPSSTISWFPGSRSSFTGRGRKRPHSISPMSAELNAIIRTSPTSLLYVSPTSRCSLNSVSPPPGERPGCYGHLSARNSTSSSSAASGRRISIPSIHSVEPFFLQDSNNLCILQQQETLKEQQRNVSCASHPSPHHVFTIPPPVRNGHPMLINNNRPPPPSYDQYMAEKLSKGNVQLKSVPFLKQCDTSCSESTEGKKTKLVCEWVDCGCTFEEMKDFVYHIEKIHVEQKKAEDFTCHWKGCFRKKCPFNARYKLLNHMRVHSGEKPHKCEIAGCDRAFSRQENLKIHLRSHTGERPYACPYEGCKRTFTNPSDRKKHEKTHQEAKPYACQIVGCDKRYTDPSSLRKHTKKHIAKNEHMKKKIRGKNEVENDILEDCITIQPVRICPNEENSPADQRVDSGIGRSPRTYSDSTSDLHLGINYASSQSNPSETTNHTSPGSHRSNSPLGDINEWEETCFVTSPNSNVPILPPISKRPIKQAPNNIQQRPVSWCTTNEDLIHCKSGLPLFGYENSTQISKNNFSASFTIASAKNILCKQQPTRCQSNLDGTANSVKPSPISLTFDVGLYSRQNQFL